MASKAKRLKPAGFLSYVRFDDKHEDGKISELRERLSSEVRAQTGDEFPIFQDRNDILWGENWEQRIDKSIDSSTFLIPIVTPSFFKSPYCRREVERFLERERKLKRNDLILPIYYIESSSWIEPEGKKIKDKIADAIFSRQYADWRELRPELITSPQAYKVLIQMAQQIREAVLRATPSAKLGKKRMRKKRTMTAVLAGKSEMVAQLAATTAALEQSPISGEATQRPSSKTEPPTRVVDAMHRGDHASIMQAIESASPGDRILVRPGLYEEAIVIDKPLEIVGDGPAGEIVIRSTSSSVVSFKTTMGRLSNLWLQQAGNRKFFAVTISQGRLEVEDCDITSYSLSCVLVHTGADPRFRRNRIHDGKEAGILIHNNGQGTFEDNEIFGNQLAGVSLKTGADPTFRRNRIHDGKEHGITVTQGGLGTFEDNDIFGNAKAGIAVTTRGNPIMRRNRIHDGNANGIFVFDQGEGTFEDNEVFANAFAGLAIATHSSPRVRRNRIHDGKQGGIFVYEQGNGLFEDNQVFGNALAGFEIKAEANPTVRGNRIYNGGEDGIYIWGKAQGTFEKNEIFGNTGAGILVEEGAAPTVRGNRIRDNGKEAIGVRKSAGGIFEDNDLRGSSNGSWRIARGAAKKLKRVGNVE